jgi:CcmD family protein
MMGIRRAIVAVASVVMVFAFSAPLAALQPTAAQEEYLPVDMLPPGQELPAAPFLIAAYAFVWVAAVAYIWSVWRRLNKVEAEMRTLERRRGHRSGA